MCEIPFFGLLGKSFTDGGRCLVCSFVFIVPYSSQRELDTRRHPFHFLRQRETLNDNQIYERVVIQALQLRPGPVRCHRARHLRRVCGSEFGGRLMTAWAGATSEARNVTAECDILQSSTHVLPPVIVSAMRAIAASASRTIVTASRSSSKYLRPASINPSAFTPLRAMSATTRREDPFKPAARVAGQKQDVW